MSVRLQLVPFPLPPPRSAACLCTGLFLLLQPCPPPPGADYPIWLPWTFFLRGHHPVLVTLVMPEKGEIQPWPLNACYQPLPVLTCQNSLSQLLLLVSVIVKLQKPHIFAHFLMYLPHILCSFSGLYLYAFNFSLFYFIHDFCFKVRGSVTVTMMNPKEKFIDPLST